MRDVLGVFDRLIVSFIVCSLECCFILLLVGPLPGVYPRYTFVCVALTFFRLHVFVAFLLVCELISMLVGVYLRSRWSA